MIGTDGRITVGGYVENATNGLASACFVARFSASGHTDTSFGSSGSTVVALGSGNTNYCHSLVVQTDGKTVIAGSSVRNSIGEFTLARYTSSGALDTSFGTAGKVAFAFGSGVDDQIKSLALQPGGKIVAAGYSRAGSNFQLAVVRLLNDSGAALPDADRLFNYAEAVLPSYFSPGTAVTQQVSGYTARVYAKGMAVGVTDGRVYVYGDVFGGLRDVGALTSLLAQALQAGY